MNPSIQKVSSGYIHYKKNLQNHAVFRVETHAYSAAYSAYGVKTYLLPDDTVSIVSVGDNGISNDMCVL